MKLVSRSGAVVWEARYAAFGEAQAAGTIENPLRFPGQYYDNETGLHYNYFRYYVPEIGRYTNSDPIGLDGGINTYAYGLLNPVKFIDPKGLDVYPVPPESESPKRAKPSACSYYEELCKKTGECGQVDEYACNAKDCCESFGDNPSSNCTRHCLIEYDKKNCANKEEGFSKNLCRNNAHIVCYTNCNNLDDISGAGGAPFPWNRPECKDAMNTMYGF